MPERSRRLKGLMKRAFEMYEIGKEFDDGRLSPREIVDAAISLSSRDESELVAGLIRKSRVVHMPESATLSLRIAEDWDAIYNTKVVEAIKKRIYSSGGTSRIFKPRKKW